MDLIRNTNLSIKSLPPSVSVGSGLGKFSEYRDFYCNLFLGAWLKNQTKLHGLTKSGETVANVEIKHC